MKRPHLAASLVLGISACASPDQARDAPVADPAPLGQPACFFRRQVHDFRALDRSSLIVFAPTRRYAYRLTVSPPASELRFADAIAFDSRSNQVCGRAGDRLLLGGGTVGRYRVVDVQRLSQAQVDSLLAGPGVDASGAALEPATDGAADIEPLENGEDP